MTHTDKIIQYLSGEMDQDEKQQFEKLLASDPDLEDEYRSVRSVWELTKEKLTLQELPDTESREAYIASVVAAHDIETYGNRKYTEEEKKLRDKIEEIGSQVQPDSSLPKKRKIRPDRGMILLLAACVALLLLVTWPDRGVSDLAASYYNPQKDVLIEQMVSRTGGTEHKAIDHFRNGRFKAAKNAYESMEQLPGDESVSRIFYAVSCFETGNTPRAVDLLEVMASESLPPLSVHAAWYLSLIHLQSGNREAALPYLVTLSNMEGMYQDKATRLIRKSK